MAKLLCRTLNVDLNTTDKSTIITFNGKRQIKRFFWLLGARCTKNDALMLSNALFRMAWLSRALRGLFCIKNAKPQADEKNLIQSVSPVRDNAATVKMIASGTTCLVNYASGMKASIFPSKSRAMAALFTAVLGIVLFPLNKVPLEPLNHFLSGYFLGCSCVFTVRCSSHVKFALSPGVLLIVGDILLWTKGIALSAMGVSLLASNAIMAAAIAISSLNVSAIERRILRQAMRLVNQKINDSVVTAQK